VVISADVRGWTPLMNAAIVDDERSARLLLSKFASWSTQGRFGFSALFWAEAARQSRSLCNRVDGSGGGGGEDSKVAALLMETGARLSPHEERGLVLLKRRYEDGSSEVKSLLTLERHAVILCSKAPDATSNMHSVMLDRIMDGADKFETQAREVLPSGWRPAVTLEQSILNLDTYVDPSTGKGISVCEAWHKEVPGEGDFPDWKSLVQHSKFFIQERVAWGDDLPPQYIFALHLYTIPCNLFSKSCAAMRGMPRQDDSDEDRAKKAAALEPWRVFIWYLWQALEKIRVQPRSVYRGISGDATQLLPEKGRVGNAILWPSFSSTSCSMDVSNAFMRAGSKGGILFKIRAKRTREIADYSYRPHERELLLAPMTRLNILGVYECSHYNMQYGEVLASVMDSSMPVVFTVPPRRLDTSPGREFVVPPEYAGKYVLVVMEEADLVDQDVMKMA